MQSVFDIPARQRYGSGRGLESAILARPELQSGFDFEELNERYPLKPIELRNAQAQSMMSREEDLEYKKSMLRDRQTDIGLKKVERDLDMFEANLNREDAMLEQVPLARQALGELDPREPDYLSKRMEVYNKYPIAFEYAPFVNTVDRPLLDRHQRTISGRGMYGGGERPVTLEDYGKALNEIDRINRSAESRGFNPEQLAAGEGYSPEEIDYISALFNRIKQYKAQEGGTEMSQGEQSLSPEPMEEGFSQQEYRPRSREEYNSVPSGAIFIDPTGNRRIKP